MRHGFLTPPRPRVLSPSGERDGGTMAEAFSGRGWQVTAAFTWGAVVVDWSL